MAQIGTCFSEIRCAFTAESLPSRLPFRCLSAAFSLPSHCLSLTFHCLHTAFQLPSQCLHITFSLPFHCHVTAMSVLAFLPPFPLPFPPPFRLSFSLPVHCLPTALSTASSLPFYFPFHCLFTASSLPFHCRSPRCHLSRKIIEMADSPCHTFFMDTGVRPCLSAFVLPLHSKAKALPLPCVSTACRRG